MKNKKKMVQTLKWTIAHLRIRRGAQARRWGAGALGARALGKQGTGARYGRSRRAVREAQERGA